MAGALALLPSVAQAQRTTEPLYVTPKVLYSYHSMDGFKTDGHAGGFNVDTKFSGKDKTDDSFGGGVAIGYDFGAVGQAPVRLELEYLYHGQVKGDYGNQSSGSINNLPMVSMDQNMKASVHTVMANVYLDFPNESDFTPYIGAGVGGAYVDAQVTGLQSLTMEHPTARYYNQLDNAGNSWNGSTSNVYGPYRGSIYGQQNSWNFAWNANAGFSYQMTPNVALDLGYRYSDFGKADFGSNGFRLGGPVIDQQYNTGSDGIPNGPPPTGDDTPGTNKQAEVGTYSYKSSMDLTAHEVILGLRFTGY